MVDHTQTTPWKHYWKKADDASGDADCGIYSEVNSGHAYSIARCPRYMQQDEWERIASFIVKATAAHADMVVALRHHIDQDIPFAERQSLALAALAKAETPNV